jgi:hypothetical protein
VTSAILTKFLVVFLSLSKRREPGNVIGIATAYGLDDRGVREGSSPGKAKNFLFSTLSRPALGLTQPPIKWVPGAFSSGVKQQGLEADHSPPTSAEVEKMWIYTFTPTYAFMAQCLIS